MVPLFKALCPTIHLKAHLNLTYSFYFYSWKKIGFLLKTTICEQARIQKKRVRNNCIQELYIGVLH